MAEAAAWAAERIDAGLPPVEIIGAAASGRVIYGAVGDGDRLEMTVIGDAVNLAAKLEKHTREENAPALVPLGLYEFAETQGFRPSAPCEHLSDRAVAGVNHTIDLVSLSFSSEP